VIELRPMAIGELIDRSASEWRHHWRELFMLFLPFQVVEFALLKAYEQLAARLFPALLSGPAVLQRAPEEVTAQLGWAVGAMAILLPLFLFNGWAAAIPVGAQVTSRLLGQPMQRAQAFARLPRQLLPCLGSMLLSLLWSSALCLLALLPAVGLMFLGIWLELQGAALVVTIGAGVFLTSLLMLGVMLWYMLRFLLVPQVLAVEELGAIGALRRAGQLISGRVGPGLAGRMLFRATVGVTVMAVILTAVNLIAGAPALILQMIYASPLDPGASLAKIPQLLLVPAQLLQVGTQGLVGPLFAVYRVLLYLDVRMRREGLDLEKQLDALEAAA
jgi:hypothetical protein